MEIKITKTRHTDNTGIAIAKIANNHWQHVDISDGNYSQVGAIYKTKIEALADHESYLKSNWGL